MHKTLILLAATIITSTLATAGNIHAEALIDNLQALETQDEITVTVDNFVRAETAMQFDRYQDLAGGVNIVGHFRTPTPIDKQKTIRMNRDTLYDFAVVDISKGATLVMPDPGDRYMSIMIVNEDHYINKVFYGGGTHKLDMDTFDTEHVFLVVRTLVNAENPDDVAAVNALQDKIRLKAGSERPFRLPNYDEESYRQVFDAAIELGRSVPDAFRMFGRKEDVEQLRHFLGTALGFGGLPNAHAFYLNVEPNLPVGEFKIEVPANVPVDAFWSVSLYNADGFFEKNDRNAYVINSGTAAQNEDGSVTVHLGGCDDNRVNCLPIMKGWNYAVRMYQPREEIQNGTWTFPTVQPVKN